MSPSSIAEAPWFEARIEGDRVVTAGSPDVVLGHPIVRDDPPDDGSWVRWRWDGTALTITNDRFRSYPCYVAVSERAVRVSPSIDRLLSLGIERDLDLDALAAFLAVGFHVGEDSPFRAIRALPPGARLEWIAGSTALTSRQPVFRTREMTRAAAIEGVTELFRQAMGRRLPDDVPLRLPVSGGKDSRHILLELRRRGYLPERIVTAAHNPYDWGDDVPVGRQLAERLGIEHVTVGSGRTLSYELRKNRMTSYASAMHAWFVPVVDALAGTATTYEGTPGYTSMGSPHIPRRLLVAAREERWDDVARSMGKKDDGRPRYLSLLRPSLREVLGGDRAAARIRTGLDAHMGSSEPYHAFRLMSRAGRELALTPNALLADIPIVHTPYFDADLLPFSMAIPAAHVDDGFHAETISADYPDVADVPYAPHRRPPGGRAYMRQLDRDLLRFLVRHARGTIIDRPALIRRAAAGAITGDGWFTWGRRYSLTLLLVQLEHLIAGEQPPG